MAQAISTILGVKFNGDRAGDQMAVYNIIYSQARVAAVQDLLNYDAEMLEQAKQAATNQTQA